MSTSWAPALCQALGSELDTHVLTYLTLTPPLWGTAPVKEKETEARERLNTLLMAPQQVTDIAQCGPRQCGRRASVNCLHGGRPPQPPKSGAKAGEGTGR